MQAKFKVHDFVKVIGSSFVFKITEIRLNVPNHWYRLNLISEKPKYVVAMDVLVEEDGLELVNSRDLIEIDEANRKIEHTNEPKYNRGDFVKHKKYKTILQIWKIMQDGDNITYEAGIPDTMFTTYSYVIAKESDLAHAYN